jgi:hypothetical protein
MPTSWNPANWRHLEEMTRAEPTLGVQDLPPTDSGPGIAALRAAAGPASGPPPVSPQHSEGLEEIAAQPADQVLQELGRAATDDLPTYEDGVEEEEEDEYPSGTKWQAKWDRLHREGKATRRDDIVLEKWSDLPGWRKVRGVWRRPTGHPKGRWFMYVTCREPNAWLGSTMVLYSEGGGDKGQGMTLRLLHGSSVRHFDDPLLGTSQEQYNYRPDGHAVDNTHGGLSCDKKGSWDHLKTYDWKVLEVRGEYRDKHSAYVHSSRFDVLMYSATAAVKKYDEPIGTPREQLEETLKRDTECGERARMAKACAEAREAAAAARGEGNPRKKPRKAQKAPEPPQVHSADAQFAAALEKLKETKDSIDRGHQAEVQLLLAQLASVRSRNGDLDDRAQRLDAHQRVLDARQKGLDARQKGLDAREKDLDDRAQRLEARQKTFDERKKRLRAQLDDDAAD